MNTISAVSKGVDSIFVKQGDIRGCWFAASLMMKNILSPSTDVADYAAEKDAFKKTSFYKDELKPMVKAMSETTPFKAGAGADAVAATLRIFGITASFHHGNVKSLLESSIQAGKPVILGIEKGYPHYIVAVGFDADGTVQYLDSEGQAKILEGNFADLNVEDAITIDKA